MKERLQDEIKGKSKNFSPQKLTNNIDKERYDKQLKTLEGKSDNLHKPKKCLSAYMIFVKETRPKIVEQYSELGALDIMKKVGELWQKMCKEPNGIKYF